MSDNKDKLIHITEHKIYINNVEIHLSNMPFKMLKYLIKNPGHNSFVDIKKAIGCTAENIEIRLDQLKNEINEKIFFGETYVENRDKGGSVYSFVDIKADNIIIRCDIEGMSSIEGQGLLNEQKVENNSIYLLRKKNEEKIMVANGLLLIGRDSRKCNYCISDNDLISLFHASIYKSGDKFILKDLNSLNGVFLNGIRLPASQEITINVGDTICLADEEFLICKI